jgi:hypothetical protein
LVVNFQEFVSHFPLVFQTLLHIADERVRVDAAKNTGTCPLDAFSRIQRRVQAELSTELLYRFLRSPHLKKALEIKDDPEGGKRRREKLEKFFGVKIESFSDSAK